MLAILLNAFAIIGVSFAALLGFDVIKHRKKLETATHWYKASIIGFIANFFDALGIGSFAISTAMLKFFKQIRDIDLPGSLNVGCSIPAILEALIFIKVIKVDYLTLITMVIASAIGAWIGASIITKLPEKKIQRIMGIALFATAIMMFLGQMHWLPVGGNATGLTHDKLAIGIFGNFIIGSLSPAGIGLFAPCMALVYFLGMSARVAFPIMMGSCALLMPTAAVKFIKEQSYNRKVALSFAIAGGIGVIIAAYLVKSLPLKVLQWLVIGIILYTSMIMLHASRTPKNAMHAKQMANQDSELETEGVD